jgi:hypothetical protein
VPDDLRSFPSGKSLGEGREGLRLPATSRFRLTLRKLEIRIGSSLPAVFPLEPASILGHFLIYPPKAELSAME